MLVHSPVSPTPMAYPSCLMQARTSSQVVGPASQVPIFARDLRQETATQSIWRRRSPAFSGTCDILAPHLRHSGPGPATENNHRVHAASQEVRPASQVVGPASQVHIFARDLRQETATQSIWRRRSPAFSGTCDILAPHLRHSGPGPATENNHRVHAASQEVRPASQVVGPATQQIVTDRPR